MVITPNERDIIFQLKSRITKLIQGKAKLLVNSAEKPEVRVHGLRNQGLVHNQMIQFR